MTKKKNLPPVAVVFSYAPLLKSDEPFLDDMDKLKDIIKKTEVIETYAKGVVWTLEDGIPVANMMFPMAYPIAAHLKEWAEGKPEEWFTLAHIKENGRYAMALMPNVEASVQRTKLRYQMIHGWSMPSDSNFQVFFAPLTFVSINSEAYDTMNPYIRDGARVKVFLADFTEDMKTMVPEKFMALLPKVREEIGTFSVRMPEHQVEYLRQMFKDE